MQAAGALIGTILGYAIGHILRIAGPQIEEMIANAIRRVIADTSEVSKPNSTLHAVVERMRQQRADNHGRDGDGERKVDSGSDGIGS